MSWQTVAWGLLAWLVVPGGLVSAFGWRRSVVRERREAHIAAEYAIREAADREYIQRLIAENCLLSTENGRKDAMLLAAWAEIKDSAQLIRDLLNGAHRDWQVYDRNTDHWLGDEGRVRLDERFAAVVDPILTAAEDRDFGLWSNELDPVHIELDAQMGDPNA